MSTRKARLLAAERATGALQRGGVLTLRDGETPEAALARAAAAGRSGSFLLMPPPVDADTWEREAAANQRELLVRAEANMCDLDKLHRPK